MAKQKPTKPSASKASAAGPWPFGYWLRLTLSIGLVWHLFVVFMAPLSLQPKWSQLSRVTAQSQLVRWYTDPLFLNGGYSFFSPDPPLVGRIIRYKVYGDSGDPIVEGEFPNRNNPNHASQWPRLWYHRHMMLVDQSSDVPVFQPEDSSSEAALRAERKNQELSLRAYARKLLRQYDGRRADLELIVHESLHPEQAREGLDPTDPSLYRTVMTVSESTDRLGERLLPDLPPETAGEPLPVGARP